ncbi:MAG TPA: DUF1801 domain-containing protein [Rhizomicrobium sp.]|jgi:hypothetical protein
MAENKTKPTKVSVSAYVDAIPDPRRREDAKTLIKLMQKATGEKPAMWAPSIIGFGAHHYVYESGREGDMPLVGFSPRKPATVLYVQSGFPGATALRAKLGDKAEQGCIYIKKLDEVDGKALETLIAKSVALLRKAK